MRDEKPSARSQDDLVGMWRSEVSRAYAGEMDRAGIEIIRAFASMFSRVSTAVVRADSDYRIATAPAGSRAVATVTLSKDSTTEALDVGEGSVLIAGRSGRVFYVVDGASWETAETGEKDITCESFGLGYQANVLAGEIDTVLSLADGSSPDLVSVVSSGPAEGGSPPILYALGRGRSAFEATGEDAGAYRRRARTMPDTVSKGAILRGMTQALSPLGFSEADYWTEDYADVGLFADDGFVDAECESAAGACPPGSLLGFVVAIPDVWSVLEDAGCYADDGFADDGFADAGHDKATALVTALTETINQKRAHGRPFKIVQVCS